MLSLRKKIISWYVIVKRDFFWRHTKDPYKIMIAEFMLHRTRASQVAPIYEAFINKYPDLQSLAGADKETVTKVTDHLGLHWRGEHFINAAKYVIDEFQGYFPETRKELLRIPGIGDYVAGAILTICFDRSEYVVDSNIARFLNRYYGLKLWGEIRRKKQIIDISRKLFDTGNSGQLLFAIIDFTFMICKPRIPLCYKCILSRECKFKNKNLKIESL